MFNRLVVPLDGSVLSEKALFYGVRLAALAQQNLLLLRVAEPTSGGRTNDLHLSQVSISTQEYLEQIKARLTDPLSETRLVPDRIQTEVIFGKPEQSIASVVSSQKDSLLVMSTHGRTGLSRVMLGSVAEGVIRRLRQPILLVGPSCQVKRTNGHIPESFNFAINPGPVVLTLDDTPGGEEILEPAIKFARQLGAEVHLLRVARVPFPSVLGEFGVSYGPDLLDFQREFETFREGAELYLDGLRTKVETNGVPCVVKVGEGEAAPVILEYIKQVKASVVGMGHRVRGGIGQLILGSVMEEVLARCEVPVLTVHRE